MSVTPNIVSLKNRQDFLRARKGKRARLPGVIVESCVPPDVDPQANVIRVGYTCTKRLGNAVRRNRTKRRLRAAARDVLSRMGRAGTDYVLIGKLETADMPFEELVRNLETAIKRIHKPKLRKPEETVPETAKNT